MVLLLHDELDVEVVRGAGTGVGCGDGDGLGSEWCSCILRSGRRRASSEVSEAAKREKQSGHDASEVFSRLQDASRGEAKSQQNRPYRETGRGAIVVLELCGGRCGGGDGEGAVCRGARSGERGG